MPRFVLACCQDKCKQFMLQPAILVDCYIDSSFGKLGDKYENVPRNFPLYDLML